MINSSFPVKFTSPIKPPSPSNPQVRIQPKRLFDDESIEEANDSFAEASLSEVYGVNFSNPPPLQDCRSFFSIADHIKEIEKYIQNFEDQSVKDIIRTKVLSALKIPSEDLRMAEIGLILFYLDKDKDISEIDSFLDFRAAEIEKRAQKYLSKRDKATSNELVPSGKTHYLMRAFVHQIFTSKQFYNRCGLTALQVLLQEPKYKISHPSYLEPEHRTQILNIVGNILKNTAFDSLFQKKIEIHPDLQDFVRFDLKLSPKTKIPSVFVWYDCLMALFDDQRQGETLNCYAVSSSLYTTENQTYKTLQMLVSWLQDGTFRLNLTTDIPIRPLVYDRLIHHRSLSPVVQNEKALSLSTIEQTLATLSVSTKHSIPYACVPIEVTLKRKLAANGKLFYCDFSKRVYDAYTYHSLSNMILAILEFSYLNRQTDPSSSPRYYSEKELFINTCINGLYVNFPLKAPQYEKAFFDKIEEKLFAQLWLENKNSENKATINDQANNTLGLDNTIHFNRLDESGFTPLKSISELQTFLKQIIIETEKEQNLFDQHKLLSRLAVSRLFKTFITSKIALQIKKAKFFNQFVSRQQVEKENLLILNQTGGNRFYCLQNVLKTSVLSKHISTPMCTDASQFLDSLFKTLQTFDGKSLLRTPRIILSSQTHDWTINPKHWKLLINNCFSFPDFYESMLKLGRTSLNYQIPFHTIKSIIMRYTSDQNMRSEMLAFFLNYPILTYGGFIMQFRARFANPNDLQALQIIEEEFWKVMICEDNELRSILSLLLIEVDAATLNRLKASLPDHPLMTNQLARELYGCLINESVAIQDPFDIELAICKHYSLPPPICLGDTNWTDLFSEDPKHKYLMILYSWIEEKPGFYFRNLDEMQKEADHHYKNCTISYPTNLYQKIAINLPYMLKP